MNNNLDIVTALIQANASVNLQDNYGSTALMIGIYIFEFIFT